MKSAKDTIKAGEVEIEVEDDTPPEDRGRKPSEPPQEVTDEELENYSEKVKSRIKHFSKELSRQGLPRRALKKRPCGSEKL